MLTAALLLNALLPGAYALVSSRNLRHADAAMQMGSASRVQVLNVGAFEEDYMNHQPYVHYHHNPKTGISSVMRLLRKGLGNFSFLPGNFAGEYTEIKAKEHKGDMFLLGTIRNPCDYYVSMWAYGGMYNQSGMYMDFKRFGQEHLFPVNLGKNKSDDRRRFSEFLRMTSGATEDGIGPYTRRVGYAYVPWSKIGGWFSAQNLSTEVLTKFRGEMRDWDIHKDVDCWVRTESVLSDLRVCLVKFEKERGGKVMWEEFEQQALNMTSVMNQVPHDHCPEYWDKANEAFIRKKDDMVFQKFGYETCCASKALQTVQM